MQDEKENDIDYMWGLQVQEDAYADLMDDLEDCDDEEDLKEREREQKNLDQNLGSGNSIYPYGKTRIN